MIRSSELLAVAVFVSFVAVVFAAAAWEGIAWFRARRGRIPPAGPARLRWRRATFAAAGAGLLCMAWGRFVEPFWPEVVRVRIESAKVRPGARPIRIVHLSDFHCDPAPRLEEDLPRLVAAERPDLVVFTGDAVNSPPGLPVFRRTMEGLAKVAPVFAVKGNWDAHYFRELERFAGTGAVALDGTSAAVAVDGTTVRVAGMTYGHGDGLEAALKGAAPGELLVLLYHTPDFAESLGPDARPGRAVPDLYLSGHTHGGQVRMPFYGALITLSRFGKKYESGLYELPGGTHLYVNRGFGMEGGPAPRVRFLCRPEITVIEIVPAPR